MSGRFVVLQGDVRKRLRELPFGCVDCVVTSPPYWNVKDYRGGAEQIGLEDTPEEYVETIVKVFKRLKPVLKKFGTVWLNIGDGYRNKQLLGIPWRVALALQADGWYLRSPVVWHKPNAMPQSVKDRPLLDYEYVFLLTKNPVYYYDTDAIREPLKPASMARWLPEGSKWGGDRVRDSIQGRGQGMNPKQMINTKGRNKRAVWSIPTAGLRENHNAAFPEKLVETCILAGCPVDGTVLDPFCGSGTTGVVAMECGARFIGIELNEEYVELSKRRISQALAKVDEEVTEGEW